MRKRIFNTLLGAGAVWALLSCGSNSGPTDNATSGEVHIAADESFQPIVDAELDVFHALYKYAKIHVHYKPEREAYIDMLRDSVRLVFMTDTLDTLGRGIFNRAKITPRITKVAVDAIALIVNKDNPDAFFTMKELEQIFRGGATRWEQVKKTNRTGEIKIIFDNNNSSNLRFIKEKFNLDSAISKKVYAAGSNKAVIDYVKSDKQAIGVIGVNWISDGDDSTSKSFLKSIKVVGISANEQPASEDDYYQPYQAYIALGLYPLKRDLYIVSREARMGLGTGFAAFVASDRGQRIILKSGLVPATVPPRIVDVKKKPL